MTPIYQRRAISPKAEYSGNKARRLFKSLLRCSALPMILMLLTLVSSIDIKPLRAQSSCPGDCDSIAVYDQDTVNNCYRFFVQNRKPTGLISSFRVRSADYSKGIDDISVSVDPTGVPGYNGPMDAGTFIGGWEDNYTGFFQDPSIGDTASLGQCDSGYIKVCLTCNEYKRPLPIYFVLYHTDASGVIVDSCISPVYTLRWYGDPCPHPPYNCREACDSLAVTQSQDPVTGETELCVTVIHQTPGDLYGFDLSIGCNSGDPFTNPNDWRVTSMPVGWGHGPIGTSGGSFASQSGYAIPNCGSATFCFRSKNCALTYCDLIDVSLTTESDSGICTVTRSIDLNRASPGVDTGCCPIDDPEVAPIGPTVDPQTGIATFCVEVHRSDAMGMNTITINHTGGREVCPETVPEGWELQSSVSGTDTYVRTTADTLGCRTLIFCYQTCDCDNSIKTVTFTVSGENLSAVVLPVVFLGDVGNCCNGILYRQDHAEITYDPVYANCLTYTLYNTAYFCTMRNDFHFTVPAPCIPSSITVPTGYVGTYNATTNTVDVVPDPVSGAEFGCCDSLVVQVCFGNCIGPWPPFTWSWSSTYNGVVNTDSTQSYPTGSMAPPPPPMKVRESGSNKARGAAPFPNPFGASSFFKTTIPYTTNGTGIARVTVTDTKGNVVLTDDESVDYAGQHFFYFSGEKLPSGTYYYQIEFPKGNKIIANRTMILVK